MTTAEGRPEGQKPLREVGGTPRRTIQIIGVPAFDIRLAMGVISSEIQSGILGSIATSSSVEQIEQTLQMAELVRRCLDEASPRLSRLMSKSAEPGSSLIIRKVSFD